LASRASRKASLSLDWSDSTSFSCNDGSDGVVKRVW